MCIIDHYVEKKLFEISDFFVILGATSFIENYK